MHSTEKIHTNVNIYQSKTVYHLTVTKLLRRIGHY